MLRNTRWLAIAVGLLLSACSNQTPEIHTKSEGKLSDGNLNPRVIYGDDDRKDLYQVTDPQLLALADSTVALFENSKVTQNSDGTFSLKTRSYSQAYDLCPSEPFYGQENGAFCSGFLVGEDIMVTAGHCIRSDFDCNNTKFVFGFAHHTNAASARTNASSDDVYSCAEVVKTFMASSGADYAVLRLDRKVLGHAPLKMRTQGQASPGDELIVIGHPAGLPTKIAGGARVRSDEGSYYRANLDTYGGNSGSAVFNGRTKEIEGILVRGETDYTYSNENGKRCRVSNQCDNSGCRGEDVTKISEVLAHVPTTIDPEPEPEPEPQQPLSRSAQVNVSIPDHNTAGVSSAIEMPEGPQGRKVRVHVDITHTWRGDLKVSLVAPDGTEVQLHNRSGRQLDNIQGTYGDGLLATDDLSVFTHMKEVGQWRLKVSDHAWWDLGKLNSWTLEFRP